MRLFWPTVDMLLEGPAWAPPEALRLPPAAFPSLGAPPAGPCILDTGSLEGAGPGVVFQQGVAEPEIAVFAFDGGTWTVDLVLRGPRPAALLFRGPVRLRGRIDARAAGAPTGGPGLGAWPGGGGGFGGAGGRSGGGAPGGRGQCLETAFAPGSGGQSGDGRGGRGGGALQVGSSGRLALEDARVVVDGADGRPSEAGTAGGGGRPSEAGTAGGGGSGGALVLHGSEVHLDRRTLLSARGGAGGHGHGGAHGGGGGGGGGILGITAPGHVFDPDGARFLVTGGAGGRAEASGRRGAPGQPGVVFLSARHPGGLRHRSPRVATPSVRSARRH